MNAIQTQPATHVSTPQPIGGLAGQVAQAVLQMLESAQRVLRADPGQAKILVDQAAALLGHPAPTDHAAPPALSGLASWQERKLAQFIGENLDRPICVGELALMVRLSPNHFTRMFKRSFGATPRDYVMRVRLEQAKTLMIQTTSPLCQIALDCGFCDQAHMSRIFHQVIGATPSRWRKEASFSLAA